MNENYVAIMQPHFLPWLGYFYLIDRAESFVILDNVQFDKRSWQQRNKFNLNLKEHWITILKLKKRLMGIKQLLSLQLLRPETL